MFLLKTIIYYFSFLVKPFVNYLTKRLFSGKINVMGKRNILIIILLISLLLGVGAFYFYLKNIKVSQDIINFVPENAIFYAELDLQNQELQNFNKQNFRGKTRFELLLKKSSFFGKLSKYLIEKSNKISLVIVDIKDDPEYSGHKIWIINSNNIHELHALMPKNFNVSILNSNTIALSENKDALRLIKKINLSASEEENSKQAIASELHKKIAKNFSNDNFLNVYLNNQYLQNKINSSDLIFPLILNNLNLDFNESAFLNLKAENNKIIYNFNALSKDKTQILGSKKFNSTENLLQLVDLENKNNFAAFFMADLENVFDFLTLEQKEIWQKKYNLDWKKIKKILNNSGIFIIEHKNNKIESRDVLNLQKYNYALIIPTDLETKKVIEYKEEIKQIIKNISAFKNPIEQIKKLLDNSKSIELIADPKSIKFISENDLEILDVENFNFAITMQDSNIILGNNKNLILEILNKQNGSTQEHGANINCDLLTGSEALIMNTNKLTSGILSFVDKLILNFEQKGKKVKLEGCLLW